MQPNRRNFLKKAALLTGSSLLLTDQNFLSHVVAQNVRSTGQVEVFINQYTVETYYAREGINFRENLDRCFVELKEAELAGFEAMANQPEELNAYIDALKKQNMQLRSIYTGGNFHDEATAETEIKRVVSLAERAKQADTKIVVLNPQPKSGKSDTELNRQNHSLDLLGSELRKLGLKLALHYHITELEFAAREFHSFMCDTNPENVSLCYDAHWSFRASNNSAVSAYSHAKLYANRIVELHLRQSQDGIWTETFMTKADLDYDNILTILSQTKDFGNFHIVLEQAPEGGTPKTLKPIDSFKQSVTTVRQMFRKFRGRSQK